SSDPHLRLAGFTERSAALSAHRRERGARDPERSPEAGRRAPLLALFGGDPRRASQHGARRLRRAREAGLDHDGARAGDVRLREATGGPSAALSRTEPSARRLRLAGDRAVSVLRWARADGSCPLRWSAGHAALSERRVAARLSARGEGRRDHLRLP